MMASEYAETCRFINTNKTSCVLTYFAFYFITFVLSTRWTFVSRCINTNFAIKVQYYSLDEFMKT